MSIVGLVGRGLFRSNSVVSTHSRTFTPKHMYRLRAVLLQPHSQYVPSTYRQLSTQKQQQPQPQPQERQQQQQQADADHREKILTIPNALTMARIVSSPYIGYLIVQGQYEWALSGCVVFGLTDALDGYIARKYNMQSFIGSILDPAADKVLMTTLTLALSFNGLMPGILAGVIIGRDLALSLAALVVRWATLPEPRTARRYFDLSVLSVEVRPTLVSKWNTALQLALVAASLAAPVCGVAAAECVPLAALQWATGATTVASGVGYLFSRDAVHRLTKAELAKRIPKPHVLPGPIRSTKKK